MDSFVVLTGSYRPLLLGAGVLAQTEHTLSCLHELFYVNTDL